MKLREVGLWSQFVMLPECFAYSFQKKPSSVRQKNKPKGMMDWAF